MHSDRRWMHCGICRWLVRLYTWRTVSHVFKYDLKKIKINLGRKKKFYYNNRLKVKVDRRTETVYLLQLYPITDGMLLDDLRYMLYPRVVERRRRAHRKNGRYEMILARVARRRRAGTHMHARGSRDRWLYILRVYVFFSIAPPPPFLLCTPPVPVTAAQRAENRSVAAAVVGASTEVPTYRYGRTTGRCIITKWALVAERSFVIRCLCNTMYEHLGIYSNIPKCIIMFAVRVPKYIYIVQ